jgi:transposase-like protein
MRGYCPRCKEYRSDNGMDAWGIIWRNGRPVCERCGSYVDVWENESESCTKPLVDNAGGTSSNESERIKREDI